MSDEPLGGYKDGGCAGALLFVLLLGAFVTCVTVALTVWGLVP